MEYSMKRIYSPDSLVPICYAHENTYGLTSHKLYPSSHAYYQSKAFFLIIQNYLIGFKPKQYNLIVWQWQFADNNIKKSRTQGIRISFFSNFRILIRRVFVESQTSVCNSVSRTFKMRAYVSIFVKKYTNRKERWKEKEVRKKKRFEMGTYLDSVIGWYEYRKLPISFPCLPQVHYKSSWCDMCVP